MMIMKLHSAARVVFADNLLMSSELKDAVKKQCARGMDGMRRVECVCKTSFSASDLYWLPWQQLQEDAGLIFLQSLFAFSALIYTCFI